MKIRPRRTVLFVLGAFVIAALMLAACGSGGQPAAPTTAPTEEEAVSEEEHVEEEHEEGDAHPEDEHGHDDEGEDHDEEMDEHMDEHSPEDHMGGAHDVPEEAAAVENPVEATDESVATGAELYGENCAVCHGETGEGDGPSATALDPPPADLHEAHVQGLTDGALFYIISHGRPESAMPAWEGTLEEEERWHVVNFMRTFVED